MSELWSDVAPWSWSDSRVAVPVAYFWIFFMITLYSSHNRGVYCVATGPLDWAVGGDPTGPLLSAPGSALRASAVAVLGAVRTA